MLQAVVETETGIYQVSGKGGYGPRVSYRLDRLACGHSQRRTNDFVPRGLSIPPFPKGARFRVCNECGVETREKGPGGRLKKGAEPEVVKENVSLTRLVPRGGVVVRLLFPIEECIVDGRVMFNKEEWKEQLRQLAGRMRLDPSAVKVSITAAGKKVL